MAIANLPIIPPSLPEGFCPTTFQQLINEGVGKAVVQFQSSQFTVVITSTTQPGSEDRDKLWHDPETGLIYFFQGGAWITPHSEPAGGFSRRIWVGNLTQLITYDGGEVGTVGDAAGPMWEQDTAFDGRSPMGVGNIPTANPAKSLAVLEEYGEGAHTQTAEEVGPHTHPLNVSDLSQSPGGGSQAGLLYQGPGTGSGNAASPSTLQVQTNTYIASQEPMPVIHPVVGVYVIKRTARIYYKGS